MYRAQLASGQCLRLKLDQFAPGLKVAVYAEETDRLFAIDYRREGPALFSVIARRGGAYQIDVTGLPDPSIIQGYELSAEELRPATAADEIRQEAEQKLAEGEKLTAKGDEQSGRAALSLYQRAFDLWEEIDDRIEAARALLVIGESFAQLGETGAAETSFRRALQSGEELQNPALCVRARNGLAYALIYANRYPEALDSCNEALQLSRRTGDERGEAQALMNLGEYHYFQGNRVTALEHWRRASPLWQKANDLRGQAQALQLQGDAYMGLTEEAKAADAYQEALLLWRALGDRRNEARTLTSIGFSHALVGDRQKALNLFQQAAEIFETLSDRLGEAMTLNKIGFVYDELGRLELAVKYYDQARRLYRALNLRIGEAGQTMKIGEIYFRLGKRGEALRYLTESLNLNRQVGNKRTISCNLNDLGWVYESGGERRRAIHYYRKSLALNREVKDKRAEAYTLNHIGRVYAGKGQTTEAVRRHMNALELNQSAGDRPGESLTRYHLSLVARQRGDLDEARRQIEASLELSESLRSNVGANDLRISLLASVRPRYEFHTDLLMQIGRRGKMPEMEGLAWQASERARARGLLDMLTEARADIHEGVQPELLKRRIDLQRRINAKADRQMNLLSGQHTAAEAETIKGEITSLLAELQQLEAQIKAASPRYASLIAPQPLTLAALQRDLLDSNTLLLEYALGDKRSFLWAVTPTGMTSYELPPRATIEQAAVSVNQRLTARQPQPGETVPQYRERVARSDAELRRLSGSLGKMLLGPAAGQLETKRLVIVAEGALQYVPFAALPDPAAGGSQPLIINHEIVTQPSASLLAELRRDPAPRRYTKAVAVLADPIFEKNDERLSPPDSARGKDALQDIASARARDVVRLRGASEDRLNLTRLPATDREADAIIAAAPPNAGRKVVGTQASRAIVASGELSPFRIVHFATHGLLDTETPELSAIALSFFDSQGQPCDGLMRLHDIYNLKLPVDLVVLSACNTALGRDVKGEGLMGLTRGFFYAGAARVAASLWKVDDDASAELMRVFYANLFTEKMSPPAALRAAQIALYRGRQWNAPFYWAAFVIQGEYR